MKKILIIALSCLLILLSLNSVLLAQDNTAKKVLSKETINEYKALKELSKKSLGELEQLGFSREQILKIKDYHKEYVKHLKQYQKLEDKALKKLGYTTEQISILRTYDESEAQTVALAASCNLALYADYCDYYASSGYTDSRVSYDFYWSGVPVFKFTDLVAVQWNDWELRDNRGFVTYKHIYGSQPDKTGYATLVNPSAPLTMGRGHQFAMAIDDNYYWCQSGGGIFTLRFTGGAKAISAYAEYGHYQLVAVPGFSIPGYGSIVFKGSVNVEDRDWADMNYSTI